MPTLLSEDYLDSQQRLALGTFAAEHAFLEAAVSMAIWGMLGVNREIGFCITADMHGLAIINLLSALGDQKFKNNPKPHEELKTIIGELKSLNTSRNRLLHNPWFPDEKPGSLRAKFITVRDGVLTEKPIKLKPNELNELAAKCGVTGDDLHIFSEKYGVSPLPSKTK